MTDDDAEGAGSRIVELDDLRPAQAARLGVYTVKERVEVVGGADGTCGRGALDAGVWYAHGAGQHHDSG